MRIPPLASGLFVDVARWQPSYGGAESEAAFSCTVAGPRRIGSLLTARHFSVSTRRQTAPRPRPGRRLGAEPGWSFSILLIPSADVA